MVHPCRKHRASILEPRGSPLPRVDGAGGKLEYGEDRPESSDTTRSNGCVIIINEIRRLNMINWLL